MKTGKTLTELAQELKRQVQSKRDFIADTRKLEFSTATKEQIGILGIEQKGDFSITPLCHRQIAERLNIPMRYYQRMLSEAPVLLATNINHWFSTKPEHRMVRTLDNQARAFLSDRYRPLDHWDLCEAVLPKIQELQCTVISCEVTETRLYLKAVTERISAEVVVGDIVQAGLVISNSEVGCGSLRVEPLVYRLACKNGVIASDQSLKKYHIGRSGDNELEGAAEFFRTETRIADDKAFWMKVTDVVQATLNKVKFEVIVNRMRQAKENKIDKSPTRVIEVTAERFSFSEQEKDSVMQHLIQGGDLNAFGLAQAISRASHNVSDYDRATDLERASGQIIELEPHDWEKLVA